MSIPVAAQLFTLRDYMKSPKDFAHTIAKVRAIGYEAVQISAVSCMNGDKPLLTAKEAKKILDDQGVRCVATHRNWPNLLSDLDKEIAFHKDLDCDYIAIGAFPEEPYGREVGAYEHFVAESDPIIKALKKEGIRFGYHNHAFEFQKYNKTNTFYDVLIDSPNKDLLLEMDFFWLWTGGVNPVTLLRRANGRVPVIHLKDYAIHKSERIFAAIGEGNLDWDEILPVCKETGVEWYIVEQDTCPRDPFDCLRSSYEYLAEKFATNSSLLV